MQSGPPILAQGGGAEVIPFANPTSWFSNIGFTNLSPTHDYYSQPSFGLPVYSASGFDLLSILTRVANRQNPRIHLGPVDMSCSFVVVDVRRYDSPVVYCSPTFCQLTGYEEHEVLGRNCRFLQSPDGNVQRGQPRLAPAADAVSHMKKSLSADKECQTTIINYKKGGTPFINLVTVIPIAGGLTGSPHEVDEIVYHVGFQVDLTQQPNAILEKLRLGNYIAPDLKLLPPLTRDQRKLQPPSPPACSTDLRSLLATPAFLASIPISSSTVVPLPTASPSTDANHFLNLVLLEALPDAVLVVSLKGSFLYVAPAIRRVLGYDPADLVGKSIASFCHPADVVPLMRELKQSSAPPLLGTLAPRTVDLLFRAQVKSGEFVWTECRGRLHAEPGKGRKAVILSARTRAMPRVLWGAVTAAAGGVASSAAHEFWGVVSAKGVFVVVGASVRAVLGWAPEELIGRSIAEVVVVGGDAWGAVEGMLVRAGIRDGDVGSVVGTRMRRREGGGVDVRVVLYPMRGRVLTAVSSAAPLVCQVQVAGAGLRVGAVARPLGVDVFEELETTRGSSWQYEMQQLRFANERLREEIGALEGGGGGRGVKRACVA